MGDEKAALLLSPPTPASWRGSSGAL